MSNLPPMKNAPSVTSVLDMLVRRKVITRESDVATEETDAARVGDMTCCGAARDEDGFCTHRPGHPIYVPPLAEEIAARPTEIDKATLADVYDGVMGRYGERLRDYVAAHGWSKKLTLRVWDGMDGCWTDCETGDSETMLRLWYEKTDGGTKNTNGTDSIDYYRLFPADTKMAWDGSPGRELFRDPPSEDLER